MNQNNYSYNTKILLKMEHSNFEIIISQYEEKNTSTIEENVSNYKYNSNTILPLSYIIDIPNATTSFII